MDGISSNCIKTTRRLDAASSPVPVIHFDEKACNGSYWSLIGS